MYHASCGWFRLQKPNRKKQKTPDKQNCEEAQKQKNTWKQRQGKSRKHKNKKQRSRKVKKKGRETEIQKNAQTKKKQNVITPKKSLPILSVSWITLRFGDPTYSYGKLQSLIGTVNHLHMCYLHRSFQSSLCQIRPDDQRVIQICSSNVFYHCRWLILY